MPHDDDKHQPLRYKIAFLNGIFMLGAVSGIALAVSRWSGAPLLAVIDLAFAAAALAMLLALRRHPAWVETMATIALALAFLIFAAAYVWVPGNANRLTPFLLLSVAAFFLKGMRAGAWWLGAIVAAIVGGYFVQGTNALVSGLDLVSAVLYLAAMAGIFYYHESVEVDRQRRRREDELQRLAHYDALTGVPNRVMLADRMAQALARAKRDQGLLAVCYLDLDGFKPINDRHGHAVGDRVLVEVTGRIRDCVREDDTVARLGGDEFVVLLVGLRATEECVGSLQRMLESIHRPIAVDGHVVGLSASIGVALYPEDEEDADTLLRHADQAMYLAKLAGKNRFHLFDPASDRRARSHHQLLQEIRQGLAGGEFELYYQPKLDLAVRRLAGAEALIRWNHPQRGLLLPGEFMRAVENTELEIELGEWVIATAADQLRRWRDAGFRIQVSINISAYHFQAPGFVPRLREQAQRYGPAAGERWLQIEVLETAALEDIVGISALIAACRELGIGFALDDFGSGYSSLTYLSQLDVDTLKIDQSFVRDMQSDKGDHAVVQGIIALARAFDMHCVAEGVESEAIHQALLQMGCETGQGNGIGLPMPAVELARWGAARSPSAIDPQA